MPSVEQWESYFDVAGILDSLGCRIMDGDAVEFGCGYGTFTIPLARRIVGTVFALDIDPIMVAATAARALQVGLKNIVIEERDFIVRGCGRESGSVSLVLLFNILHIENPVSLLAEAHRVLRKGALSESFTGTAIKARLEVRRLILGQSLNNAASGGSKPDWHGFGTKFFRVHPGTGEWCWRKSDLGQCRPCDKVRWS
jgi:SAM-dependent methyltransferase